MTRIGNRVNVAAIVGTGVILPLTIDFSLYPDGSLPSRLTGPTWSIVSGKASNTPTLGSEMYSDPGLEATYTDGKCASVGIQAGSPTMSDGSPEVHGGSHAQQMIGVGAGDVAYADSPSATANTWYLGHVWYKRTAGAGIGGIYTNIFSLGTGIPAMQKTTYETAWTQNKHATIATSTGAIRSFFTHTDTGNTIIYDDISAKPITSPSQFAFLTSDISSDIIVKAGMGTYDCYAGVVVRANSRTSPTTYIAGMLFKTQSPSSTCKAILIKFVNSTPTVLISATTVTFVEHAYLEVRASGSSVGLYYNGTQVGLTQTVTDGLTNQIHGLVSAGGAETFEKFFCINELVSLSIGAWGDSHTAPDYSWATLTKNWISEEQPQYTVSWYTQAMSGNWPWSNLVRYNAGLKLASPDIVLCDLRPTDTGRELKSAEALLRRIWTDRPTARIMSATIPATTDHVTIDAESAQEIAADAIMEHYGVIRIDLRQRIIDLIAAGGTISDYFNVDWVHLSEAGHAIGAELCEAYIFDHPEMLFEAEDHSTLPTRLYDDGGYERTPIRKDGTDYDSKSAGWTESGTQIESSTEGATVTYSGTFQSIGIDNGNPAQNYHYMDIQIDGGAWLENVYIGRNGTVTDLITYGAHTITLRVRAADTVTIVEFWAI